MGGNISKEGNSGQSSSPRSSTWCDYHQETPSYATESYPSQTYYDPPSQDYSTSEATESQKSLNRKYSRIADNYRSLEEVSNLQ